MSDIERGKAILERLLADDVIRIRPSDRERFMDEWCEAMELIEQAARQSPASGEVEPLGYLMTHPRKPPMAVTASSSHPEAREADAILGWSYTPLYAHPPAKVPEGWQIHAKVNMPAPDNTGQRIIGYRVTLPDSAGLSGVCDYLPSLTTPTPATTPQPAQQGSVPEFDYDHPTYCEIIERIAEATHRLLIAAGHDAETALDMDEALEANIYKNIDMVALELEGAQQGSVLEGLKRYTLGTRTRSFFEESWEEPTIEESATGEFIRLEDLSGATPQPEGDGSIRRSEAQRDAINHALDVLSKHGDSFTSVGAMRVLEEMLSQPPVEQEGTPHHRSSEQ